MASKLQTRMAGYLERDGYEVTFRDPTDEILLNQVVMEVRNPRFPNQAASAQLVSYTNRYTGRLCHYAAFYYAGDAKKIPSTRFSGMARIYLGSTK